MVASDIIGVSGRDVMAALIARQRDPQVLAQMARARTREAFVGHFVDLSFYDHNTQLGTERANPDHVCRLQTLGCRVTLDAVV